MRCTSGKTDRQTHRNTWHLYRRRRNKHSAV